METMILSLKNIYKLLMYSDFPIYSEAVIHKRNKKGQTLQRFWRERLTEPFRAQSYGRRIWRGDGGRNRHVSEICNRSGEMKYYHEYAREISGRLNEEMLLDQLHAFTEFLRASEYKREVLLRRVKEFLRLLDMDTCMTEAIRLHLADTLSAASWAEDIGESAVLFHAGYLLTVMTIYAAAGEAMGEPALARLRAPEYGIQALFERQRRQSAAKPPLEVITAHCTLIEDHPLSPSHFFGREDTFLDLREMVRQQGKCLVSGMGGVGKTEMLRQLVRWCREESVVDALAVVAYRGDLAESLRSAFPHLYRQVPDECVPYILRTLARRAQSEKLLVVVDDVPSETAPDEITSLAQLPCAVLVTSRRRELDGFEAYQLPVLTKVAGSLIFRDNYGKPLSEADRTELFKLLDNELLCQPLALHLMARAAAENNWSMSQLRAALEEKGLTLASATDTGVVSIEQLYASLYRISRVPAACHELTKLFTLLPRGSYSADFLRAFFPSVCGRNEELETEHSRLVAGGWLESDGQGCSMHPLIAQSLRPKTRTEKQLGRILHDLHEKMPREKLVEYDVNESDIWLYRCLLYLNDLMTGSISPECLADIADAMRLSAASTPQGQKRFRQKMAHCANMTEDAEMACVTLLCVWSSADEERVEELFRKQQDHRTVTTERFQAFCIAANDQLVTSKPELAEQMLQAALREEQTSERKAVIYRQLVINCEYRGDSVAALRWAEIAVDHVRKRPECGAVHSFYAFSALAQLYMKLGQMEKAEPVLAQLESLWLSLTDAPVAQMEYWIVLGLYERFRGNLDKAESAYGQLIPMVEHFYGRNLNYYVELAKLAVVYHQQKRYDKAMAAYKEVLSQNEGNPYFDLTRRFYAGMLLDMEKPEPAMELLDVTLPAARQQGGLVLGETLRNMARAWAMLGDTERERLCLAEAYPLLAEHCGAEDPRTVAARERLAELND